MSVYDDLLVELRAMRASLDRIAASVTGEQTREELLPLWVCGHRHASRKEAMECSSGFRVIDPNDPPNAAAGAFG